MIEDVMVGIIVVLLVLLCIIVGLILGCTVIDYHKDKDIDELLRRHDKDE